MHGAGEREERNDAREKALNNALLDEQGDRRCGQALGARHCQIQRGIKDTAESRHDSGCGKGIQLPAAHQHREHGEHRPCGSKQQIPDPGLGLAIQDPWACNRHQPGDDDAEPDDP
ncbi:hypothetical protein D3C84_1072670 [compost metagenome]